MLKRLSKFFRTMRYSIRVKLIYITVLLILCPVIIATSLSYYQYSKNLEQKSADSAYQTIVQLSDNLNSYVSELMRLSSNIYYNDSLMDELSQKNQGTALERFEREFTIEGQLNGLFIESRDDVLSAYILSGGMIYRSGVYNESVVKNVNFEALPWYRKALSEDGVFYLPTHLEDLVANPSRKVFSIVRRINSIQKIGKVMGVLKIDIDYDAVKTICDKVNMGKDGGLFIEDQNGAEIYSSISHKDYAQLNKLAKNFRSGRYTEQTIGGKRYLFSSTQIQNADWTVISLKSVEELNQNAFYIRNATIFTDTVCCAVAIVILLFFMRGFLNPLLEIIMLMKEVQTGDFNVNFPQKRHDEIGYLGSSFNMMVNRLDQIMKENTRLLREVYETRLLQNEAQINALYSQIKPHFLFNTLNMISLLVRCGKDDVALDNIDRLSDLLRCMTHFNREVPIAEEIALLDAYLSIQKTRYTDRLVYSIDIDSRLDAYAIPALIFQPIVENTIIHGCESRSEKTVIKIYSKIEKNIEICFEDEAGGMDAQTLSALTERINLADSKTEMAPENGVFPPKITGIGLQNVNRRLKLKFGDEYGLVVSSEKKIGTTVRIILPKPENWSEK
jgi:Predicted signal transduction protein with a C-terminal ATPase domain